MLYNVILNIFCVELCKMFMLVLVVMMGFVYMQLMMLFDIFGIVLGFMDGYVLIVYVFVLIVILFMVLSYGKLVCCYFFVGFVYIYVQKFISLIVGFMVGWFFLFDYLLVLMINILLVKIYFEVLVFFILLWMFVVVLVVFMIVFNLCSLKFVVNFNIVIVVLQVVLIVVILGMVVYGVFEGEGVGMLVSICLFWFGDVYVILMIIGVIILCFFFIGFDGISNLLEEIKDVECVILCVIFLIVLIGGMIFIFVIYFLQLYFLDIFCFKDLDVLQFEIMLYVVGKVFQVGVLIFFIIIVLVFGMVVYVGVVCLMYVMGCDGVFLKSFFGYVYLKWCILVMNIILVGVIVLLVINFDLVMVMVLINFGVLVVFIFVNLLVILQFWICEKCNKMLKDYFQYLFLLMCGVLIVGVLWVNLEESLMVLGLIWVVIGLIYLVCVIKSFCNLVLQYEDVV